MGKYEYLKDGQWQACQTGTTSKSVLSDDQYGSGCIMTIGLILLVLVMVIGFYAYIV